MSLFNISDNVSPFLATGIWSPTSGLGNVLIPDTFSNNLFITLMFCLFSCLLEFLDSFLLATLLPPYFIIVYFTICLQGYYLPKLYKNHLLELQVVKY